MTPSVQRLYEVFGRVARPARLDGCPHCVDPAAGECLLDRPLPGLTGRDLSSYAHKAVTTWGGPAELRYFLPRLLECVAAGDPEIGDPEIVLGKLARADWRSWPAGEPAAVEDFLSAWWEATLSDFPTRPPVDTVLAAVAATETALGPCLDRWGRLDRPAAVRQLHDLVMNRVAWEPGPPRLLNAFLDRRGRPHAEIVAWLTGGAAVAAVRAAYERPATAPVRAHLEVVEGRLSPSAEPGACACRHQDRRVPVTRGEALDLAGHAVAVAPLLDAVARDGGGWLSVLLCRLCGRYWAEDSLSSGHADLFFVYPVDTADPQAWLAAAEPLAL